MTGSGKSSHNEVLDGVNPKFDARVDALAKFLFLRQRLEKNVEGSIGITIHDPTAEAIDAVIRFLTPHMMVHGPAPAASLGRLGL